MENQIIDEIDDSQIIWRYMDLTKFYDLIINKNLYFVLISKLQDLYEGSIPPWYFWQSIIVPIGGHSNRFKKDRIANEILKENYKINKNVHERYVVNCWTIEETESFALWKIFTNNENGIAIKSSYKKIKQAINYPDCNIKIKKVDYNSDLKNLEGETIVTTKKVFYKYENELRLFTESHKDLLFPVDINSLIENIYLSPFMESFAKNIVKSLIEKINPSLIVRIKESSLKFR